MLAALGSPVVFPAPPTPKQIAPAVQLVPPTLQRRGFTGWVVDGVSLIRPPMVDVPGDHF